MEKFVLKSAFCFFSLLLLAVLKAIKDKIQVATWLQTIRKSLIYKKKITSNKLKSQRADRVTSPSLLNIRGPHTLSTVIENFPFDKGACFWIRFNTIIFSSVLRAGFCKVQEIFIAIKL